jgi:hypothetical protein
LRRIILAVLVLIGCVGLVMSTDTTPLEVDSRSVVFNYEDSVSGNGNFGLYEKIAEQGAHANLRDPTRLDSVDLQKMTHGTGSIDESRIINSTQSGEFEFEPDSTYAYSLIGAMDNSNIVYSPQTMSIGNGYYSTHPVKFNSLIGDKVQVKNYASGASMDQDITYAHAINTDTLASVEDDFSGWNPAKSLTRTLLNSSGAITGNTHIGALQGDIYSVDLGKSVLHEPEVYIDEDYKGTYNLQTKMSLTMPVSETWGCEDWLPCSCYAGWDDMNLHDQRYHSAKGFFDCTTCPSGFGKAQCT